MGEETKQDVIIPIVEAFARMNIINYIEPSDMVNVWDWYLGDEKTRKELTKKSDEEILSFANLVENSPYVNEQEKSRFKTSIQEYEDVWGLTPTYEFLQKYYGIMGLKFPDPHLPGIGGGHVKFIGNWLFILISIIVISLITMIIVCLIQHKFQIKTCVEHMFRLS